LSVSTRLPIVAVVATIVFVPVVDKAHHILGHTIKRGPVYSVECTLGEAIPDNELTRRIHIAGHRCRAHTGGRFRLEPRGTICPKNIWWRDGKCSVAGHP
jgi:hypothetical protein